MNLSTVITEIIQSDPGFDGSVVYGNHQVIQCERRHRT